MGYVMKRMYLVHGVGEEEVKTATLADWLFLVASQQLIEHGLLFVLGQHLPTCNVRLFYRLVDLTQ